MHGCGNPLRTHSDSCQGSLCPWCFLTGKKDVEKVAKAQSFPESRKMRLRPESLHVPRAIGSMFIPHLLRPTALMQ